MVKNSFDLLSPKLGVFWVILFLESQVFSLLFVFFVGTELLRAPAKGGARVTSAGQVVDKDLVAEFEGHQGLALREHPQLQARAGGEEQAEGR